MCYIIIIHHNYDCVKHPTLFSLSRLLRGCVLLPLWSSHQETALLPVQSPMRVHSQMPPYKTPVNKRGQFLNLNRQISLWSMLKWLCTLHWVEWSASCQTGPSTAVTTNSPPCSLAIVRKSYSKRCLYDLYPALNVISARILVALSKLHGKPSIITPWSWNFYKFYAKLQWSLNY